MISRIEDIGADVVLIGAGIMSATLGMLLKQLKPDITIKIYERLDVAAAESSDAWNNAGTGHSAFCELNYTPEQKDGSIDISKAIKIAESFEVSKQFWAYLAEQKIIEPPQHFIRSIPHMSFVWGDDNVSYLHKRYEAMQQNHLFKEMQYSEVAATIQKWAPLIMEGRKGTAKIAATKMDLGTDVNFGALTRCLLNTLKKMPGVQLHFNCEVNNLNKQADDSWRVELKNHAAKKKEYVFANFVFIGAGGYSLTLLEKSGIEEGKGYGGFPVSGQWLTCNNENIIAKHHAKVYGKAAVGSPPMSVPHLDTRLIDGKQALLFGPYAGFSTKFLKNGSFFDMLLSIRLNNIIPMISAGLHNIPLTKYLIQQVRQSPKERLQALQEYFPDAQLKDWQLKTAGQRVQVIKKDEEEGGILEFGTEVVSAKDGSIAALLGASPGASTAVSIMLDLLKRCFGKALYTDAWQTRLQEMIPSYGKSLGNDAALCKAVRSRTKLILNLNYEESL